MTTIILSARPAVSRRCYRAANGLRRSYYSSKMVQGLSVLNHDRISAGTPSLFKRKPSFTCLSSSFPAANSLDQNNSKVRQHRQLRRRNFASTKNHDPSNQYSKKDDQAADAIPACLVPYVGMPSHPDVIELEAGQRLVAIGDVHGDFEQFLNALILAGVVEEEEEVTEDGDDKGRTFVWTGGSTILVQIGDVLDRGPNELACWQLLAELSRQAHVAGGRVISLYGNHELWTSVGFYQLDQERYFENLDYDDGIDDHFELYFGDHLEQSLAETEDDWRDSRLLNELVTSGVVLHPRKVAARWAAMEPGGLLAHQFLSKFKIAVQVGETLLVHAGMVPEHLDRFGGIAGMNDATRNWILKRVPRVGRTSLFIPPNDPEARLRTYISSMPDFFMEGDDNAHSPIWMRDYSDPPDDIPFNPNAREMLDEVLQRVKASRIVMGHTPQSQINAALNGKAWRIDVGMSRGMNGTYPEVLEVVKNDAGEETVWVLTSEGRIPAEDRHIPDDDHADHQEST